MRRILIPLFLLTLLAPLHAQDIPVTEETKAFADFTRDWRNDPAWNDGQAPIAAINLTSPAAALIRRSSPLIIA